MCQTSVMASARCMYWLSCSFKERDLYAGAAKGWQCVQGYKLCPDEPMNITQATVSTWLLDTEAPPNRQTQHLGRCTMQAFACVSQVHLSRSEAWFAMIQVALDLGYDLSIWKGHEGVGMVEVCCNHRAWFCLVLILHDARLQ